MVFSFPNIQYIAISTLFVFDAFFFNETFSKDECSVLQLSWALNRFLKTLACTLDTIYVFIKHHKWL